MIRNISRLSIIPTESNNTDQSFARRSKND